MKHFLHLVNWFLYSTSLLYLSNESALYNTRYSYKNVFPCFSVFYVTFTLQSVVVVVGVGVGVVRDRTDSD